MTDLTTTVPNQTLVALTPQEVAPAQQDLIVWCTKKMHGLGLEYAELQANLRVATRNRWSRGGLIKAVATLKRRIQYYGKIKAAVQAGYLIVPNFPIEVIAVRVARDQPYASKEGRWASDVNTAQPELLPVGHGRYVDEVLFTERADYVQTGADGKDQRVQRTRSTTYDDAVDFPIVGVKPIIMKATARAMALRIFDRIGVANHSGRTHSRRQRKADPIIIGQIVEPKYKGRWNEKVVSFFVAWWLDTDSL